MSRRKHTKFESRQEEIDVVTRAKAGDQRALAHAIEVYEGLAYDIARKLSGPDEQVYEDLLQEARVVILKLLKTFDPNVARFSTYGYRKIRNTLRVVFNRMVNLPSGMSESMLLCPDNWTTTQSIESIQHRWVMPAGDTFERKVLQRDRMEKCETLVRGWVHTHGSFTDPDMVSTIFLRYNTEDITLKELAGDYKVTKQRISQYIHAVWEIVNEQAKHNQDSVDTNNPEF